MSPVEVNSSPPPQSVGEALLPPPEAPDGVSESLRGQLVVLLQGLTELLPGPIFYLCHSLGCGTLDLTVPVSRLRSPTSQPQPIGLLFQLDNISYLLVSTTGLWCLSIDAEKMGRTFSILTMSPTSPRIWSKLSQRWELNTSLSEGSTRPSQQTLTMRLGLPSLSGFLLLQRIQPTTRW
ncbi:hypothetical protein AMECASPLE_020564 [Ameca splendens]|uniref:Uncharacterized protein n=1 Tax=Ameca splendens TaxID=208324 RepID=A0ABV0Z284_9TELE